MIISVKVVPNARQERIVREGERYKVYLCAPAVDGKANARLVAYLSALLGVKSSGIAIVRGLKARQKQVEIRGLDVLPAKLAGADA